MIDAKRAIHKWVYAIAGLLAFVSVFLPWWSLHAAGGTIITNRGVQSLASFDLGVGPTGVSVTVQLAGQSVPFIDPTGLLSGVSLLIAITLFPVSASIVLAFVNAVYCPVRDRKGDRLLIAPLWIIIALVWWFFYFLSLNRALGGSLQPTGTTNVVLGNYTLGTVAWGWSSGLWLATISVVLFLAASAISGWGTITQVSPTSRTVGFHSVGLLIIGGVNALFGVTVIFLAAIFGGFTVSLLVLVPTVLLFGMASLARGETPALPPSALNIGSMRSMEGMTCRICGASVPAGATKCLSCGTSL